MRTKRVAYSRSKDLRLLRKRGDIALWLRLEGGDDTMGVLFFPGKGGPPLTIPPPLSGKGGKKFKKLLPSLNES